MEYDEQKGGEIGKWFSGDRWCSADWMLGGLKKYCPGWGGVEKNFPVSWLRYQVVLMTGERIFFTVLSWEWLTATTFKLWTFLKFIFNTLLCMQTVNIWTQQTLVRRASINWRGKWSEISESQSTFLSKSPLYVEQFKLWTGRRQFPYQFKKVLDFTFEKLKKSY